MNLKLSRYYYILFWCFFFFSNFSLDAYFFNSEEKSDNEKILTILDYYEEQLQKNPNNLELLIAMGDAYYSLQLYPEAIDMYRRALTLDPKNESIKISLANSHLFNADEKESQKLFQEVLRKNPKSSKALSGLGRLKAFLGQLDEAYKLYEHSLSIDEKDSDTLFYLGELQIDWKNYEEAKNILDPLYTEVKKKGSALSKKNPIANWIGQAYFRATLGSTLDNLDEMVKEGDLATALLHYKQLLEQHPDQEVLYIKLSQLYNRLGRKSEARSLLDQAHKIFPKSARIQLAEGEYYLENGDYQQAKNILLEVAQKSYLKNQALAKIGKISVLEGNNEEAEKYFKKALLFRPDDVFTLSYLGELKISEENYKEATQIYKHILAIEPDSEFAKKALLKLQLSPYEAEINKLIANRDFKKAENLYKEIIIKQPYNPSIYENLGNFYLKTHQLEKAEQVFKRGITLFPKKLTMILGLANSYQQRDAFEKSNELYEKILEKEPNQIDSLLGLARNFEKTDRLEEERALYQQILSLNPANQEALGNLANLEIKEKNYSAAKELLFQLLVLTNQADWVIQLMKRAQLGDRFDLLLDLEKQGNLTEAIQLAKKLINQSPKTADLYNILGRMYLSQGNIKEAIDVYYNGLIAIPNDLLLRTSLANALIQNDELDAAKRLLEFVLILDPFDANALLGMGNLFFNQEDSQKALEYYQQAYSVEPNNLATISTLASFYMAEKEFKKAEKLFQIIIEKFPEASWANDLLIQSKAEPLLYQAHIAKNTHDYEEAKKTYLQLINQFKENISYILLYGKFLIEQEKVQEAIFLYHKTLQDYPDSLPLLNALGFAYIEQKNLELAQRFFQDVLEKDPKNSEAYAGLGKIAEDEKDFSLAEENYNYALELNPKNISALVFLAEMELNKNNFDEAIKIFERIQQISPKDSWIDGAIKKAKNSKIIAIVEEKESHNDTEGIQDLFNELIIKSCGDPEYFYLLGSYYHREKKYELAVRTFLEGLKIAPESDLLLAGLGSSYISLKKWKLAEEAFKQSLSLDPRNVVATSGLARVETEFDHFEKAHQLLDKSFKENPKDAMTLSSLGILLSKEKEYEAAQKVLSQLMRIEENAKWTRVLYENALNGHEIDRLDKLFDEKKYEQSAAGYMKLIEEYPENADYIFRAGLAYLRLEKYGKALEIFSMGYERDPKEDEFLVSMGYSNLFLEEYGDALTNLLKVLKKDPKNVEAIAGVGRINALLGNTEYAEELFQKALEIEPKNQSALTFYSNLLMKEKEYRKAYEYLTIVESLLSENEKWIEEALKDAEDGPLIDVAKKLVDQELFELAICVYLQLIESYPKSAARYNPLGQMHLDLYEPCQALSIFQCGLAIDDEMIPLWRGVARAYIDLEYYNCALEVISELLAREPKDASSWALLGRVEALRCSYCRAEFYYCHALSLDPENVDALSFFADLKRKEHYFFSSRDAFGCLIQKDPCPKWIKRGFLELLAETSPAVFYRLYDHQEFEWTEQLGRWTANYGVLGARTHIQYPVCDSFYTELILGLDLYKLRDYDQGALLYSIDTERAKVAGTWVQNSNRFFDWGLGISSYSRYRQSTFHVKKGTYIEPSLKMTYHAPLWKFTLGISSESDLIARNFDKNEAKLVGQYLLNATYETELRKRNFIGTEASVGYYNDFGGNLYGRALGWYKWKPFFCPNNLTLGYQFRLGGFSKNIPDYYTYHAQIVNLLDMKWEKKWRIQYANTLYTSLNFALGEQNTYTRFRQFIVTDATPPDQKLSWDSRFFGLAGGKIECRRNCLLTGLIGELYLDSRRYTMGTIEWYLKWTF